MASSRLGVTGGDSLRIQVNGVEAVGLSMDRQFDTQWNGIERTRSHCEERRIQFDCRGILG